MFEFTLERVNNGTDNLSLLSHDIAGGGRTADDECIILPNLHFALCNQVGQLGSKERGSHWKCPGK